MLTMRKRVDEEYNIEYSTIVILEELLAPTSVASNSSGDSMIEDPPEDNPSD